MMEIINFMLGVLFLFYLIYLFIYLIFFKFMTNGR